MSIKYAILGLLSLAPLTGYDLKKHFTGSLTLYWSGNSNQIYKTLVELHDENLVSLEVQQQADKPPRKIYTISDAGIQALRNWMMTTPEAPQMRNAFLIQLNMADMLTVDELNDLFSRYESEVQTQLMMVREANRRNTTTPRSPREALLWRSISTRWTDFYEQELSWLRDLRQALSQL